MNQAISSIATPFTNKPMEWPWARQLHPSQLIMDDLTDYTLRHHNDLNLILFRYVDFYVVLYHVKIYVSEQDVDKDQVYLHYNRHYENLPRQHQVELEENNSLPFLDTMVYRESRYLYTNWNIKEYHFSRYLNLHSDCPYHQKINSLTNTIKKSPQTLFRFHKPNLQNILKLFTPLTLITASSPLTK